MRSIFILFSVFFLVNVNAQPASAKLLRGWETFIKDPQMRHAIAGFSVQDANSGVTVFERNAEFGLAPASIQKVITSVAALELLGKEFRYNTIIRKITRAGNKLPMLEIVGSGDPTFGSWRFKQTTDTAIANKFVQFLRQQFSKESASAIVISDDYGNALPGGFIWDDIGNYYGAGSRQLNWRENQYDLYFESDNSGTAKITRVVPAQHKLEFRNMVLADKSVTGDEIYIYSAPESGIAYVEGKMPLNKKNFIVSGSMPDPAQCFSDLLRTWWKYAPEIIIRKRHESISAETNYEKIDTIYVYQSPTLDSINYYFLRRSINLYGESLLKAMAVNKNYPASTEKAVEVVKGFFTEIGIDKSAINIFDGSGLSPQNRVTARALSSTLVYAKKRSWFGSFYHALPEYNGIKMKSGSISGVRAFAGYHKATDGKEYAFSIIVNNFRGSAGEIVRKIYKLLDGLK